MRKHVLYRHQSKTFRLRRVLSGVRTQLAAWKTAWGKSTLQPLNKKINKTNHTVSHSKAIKCIWASQRLEFRRLPFSTYLCCSGKQNLTAKYEAIKWVDRLTCALTTGYRHGSNTAHLIFKNLQLAVVVVLLKIVLPPPVTVWHNERSYNVICQVKAWQLN